MATICINNKVCRVDRKLWLPREGVEILPVFMRHFEANHKSRILKEE